MSGEYVEQRDNGYWVVESQISLDSIVYAFLDGVLPDAIATEFFPVLLPEQVYGALNFYLTRRAEVDKYLEQRYGSSFGLWEEKSNRRDIR